MGKYEMYAHQLGQKADDVDPDPDPDQLRSALIFGWLDLDRDPDQKGKKDPQTRKEISCFEALDVLF
jgi:hypothetical protein